MSHPTIQDAKDLAYRLRQTGVIIVTVDLTGGPVDAIVIGTASYGMTRVMCDAMKCISDQIHEKIQSGEISPMRD